MNTTASSQPASDDDGVTDPGTRPSPPAALVPGQGRAGRMPDDPPDEADDDEFVPL